MSVSILFGQNKTSGSYSDSKIVSCDAETSVTVIGDTVSIDQFHAEVIGQPDAVAGSQSTITDIESVPYGTPIWFYVGQVLYGKFYFASAERISASHYSITAMSAMGVLESVECYGGIYNDSTFSTVAASIIGNTLTYSIEAQVASIPVRGWLPISTKKDAMHQLMLAVGADVKKNANGDMYICFNNGNESKTIPDGRVFIDGTIRSNSQATEVDVTEHSFVITNDDATVTLFDNTNGEAAYNSVVKFSSAPIHNLVATGNLTISEQNCNYAIVTGNGKLTGKTYTHTTKITRAVDNSATGSSNVATVDAGTLISELNSGNVAQRLLAYYKSAGTISADIIVADEKAGDKVELTNPFGELSSAYIKSMDIIGGGNVSARCEFITGYTPCFQGNTYHAAVLLTGSGTYTVPSGKNYITAILIGGGNGGNGGGRGSNGSTGSTSQGSYYEQDYGEGGSGGAAGQGGNGGKIYQKVFAVTPGQTISYSCGAGGSGGSANGGAGSAGGATTFGSYSSANGSSAADGVVNRYTGTAYGFKGTNGTSGGKGGDGGWSTFNRSAGDKGSNVLTWTGGNGGSYTNATVLTTNLEFCGNGGGGAAVGANGSAGTNGAKTNGRGGNGASSTVVGSAATVYGAGGNGGNGGGGGGGNGATACSGTYWTQSGGTGGNGSAGGAGMAGCIIIYV